MILKHAFVIKAYIIICLMGNSEGRHHEARFKDFQMQKYMNRGLNQNQILQIKEAFDYC